MAPTNVVGFACRDTVRLIVGRIVASTPWAYRCRQSILPWIDFFPPYAFSISSTFTFGYFSHITFQFFSSFLSISPLTPPSSLPLHHLSPLTSLRSSIFLRTSQVTQSTWRKRTWLDFLSLSSPLPNKQLQNTKKLMVKVNIVHATVVPHVFDRRMRISYCSIVLRGTNSMQYHPSLLRYFYEGFNLLTHFFRLLDVYVITLSRSLVVPFLTYSDRRDLRETAWWVYVRTVRSL